MICMHAFPRPISVLKLQEQNTRITHSSLFSQTERVEISKIIVE